MRAEGTCITHFLSRQAATTRNPDYNPLDCSKDAYISVYVRRTTYDALLDVFYVYEIKKLENLYFSHTPNLFTGSYEKSFFV